MSGHSKWKKIKRQKGAADKKKGNIFTKLSQEITLAAREGGSGDLDLNFLLRIAVDKAKEVNMPKDTIERAIDKGIGKGDKGPLEATTYELVDKNGVAILVDYLTDNRNRTIGDIRKIISKYNFSLGSGGVLWQFKTQGEIIIKPYKVGMVLVKGKRIEELTKVNKEDLILSIMDINGVKDIKEKGEDIIVYTMRGSFRDIYEIISRRKIKVHKAAMVKLSKSKVELSSAALLKIDEMIEELEGEADVISVWDNVDRE